MMKTTKQLFLFLLCITLNSYATDYYVDATNGSDSNSGESSAVPWQSLSKINGFTFSPGDNIYFKAGETWVGSLTINNSGTIGNPITYSSYGDIGLLGKPYINGDDVLYNRPDFPSDESYIIFANNKEYISLINLEVSGHAGSTLGINSTIGILIYSDTTTSLKGYVIKNVTVRDVFHSPGATGQGADTRRSYGICFFGEEDSTWTDGLLIEDCFITQVQREAIRIIRCNNIVVKNNSFYRTGGSSTVVSRYSNLLYENNRCEYSGAGATTDDSNRMWNRGSSLWVIRGENAVIKNNIFKHSRGWNDSYGMHVDFENKNVLVEKNYSEDNEGGFIQILGDNHDITYRYNISLNDGFASRNNGALIHMSDYAGEGVAGIQSDDIKIYNNTVYVSANSAINPRFRLDNHSSTIKNNIFYIQSGSGSTPLNLSTSENGTNIFTNNLFFGNTNSNAVALDSNPIQINPLLENPGSSNPDDYKLLSGSPALGTGELVSNNGGFDYFGNPVSSSLAPNIGADNSDISPLLTTTLSPLDDSYVRRGTNSGVNYGSENRLVVKNSNNPSFSRESVIKFDLSSLSGSVDSAKLRLYLSNYTEESSPTSDIEVYHANSDSWSESTVTGNDIDSSGSVLTSVTVNSTLQYYEWDVTDLVKAEALGDGFVSFILKSANVDENTIQFHSRENTNVPQLLIVDAAPLAPSGLNASAQGSTIALNWTDNSSNELNFVLERSLTSGGTFNTIATLGADTTSYTDNTGSPSTTYYYRVKATNADGDSAYSNESSAIFNTLDKTTLNPLDDSYVRRGEFSGVNYGTLEKMLVKNSVNAGFDRETVIKFDLSSLPGSVDSAKLRLYLFHFIQQNAPSSTVEVFHTNIDDSWLEETVTANDIDSSGGVLASFTFDSNSPDKQYYEWDVTDLVKSEALGDGFVSFILKSVNIDENTIRFDSKENTNLPQLLIEHAEPLAPSGLNASAQDGTIVLNWTDNSLNELNFVLERSLTSGGPFNSIATLGADTTSYTDNTGSPSVTYYYRVKATNADGESAYSNESSATFNTLAQTTLNPLDDSFLRRGDFSGDNFGSLDRLVVKKANTPSFDREAVIKFDLSSLSSSVDSAKLRLYMFDFAEEQSPSSTIEVYHANTDIWSESTVTANDIDSSGSVLASVTVNSTLQYYEWDVTDLVKSEALGDGFVSFILKSANAEQNTIQFHSRENTNLPQLLIEQTTLSLEEEQRNKSILLSPNPTINNLKLKASLLKGTTIDMFGISGVFIKRFDVKENINLLNIDTSQLSSGIYLLKINDVSKSSRTLKFVKN